MENFAKFLIICILSLSVHAIEFKCYHDPDTSKLITGVLLRGGSGPQKREASNFTPFRLSFFYHDSGVLVQIAKLVY